MKPNTYILNLAVILIAFTLYGCRDKSPMTVGIGGRPYTLKPLTDATPIDLSGVEFIGYCSKENRQKIAKSLGRIPIPKLLVKKVWVVWAEKQLAARVEVGNNYIYLVQTDNGEWDIKGGLEMVPALSLPNG